MGSGTRRVEAIDSNKDLTPSTMRGQGGEWKPWTVTKALDSVGWVRSSIGRLQPGAGRLQPGVGLAPDGGELSELSELAAALVECAERIPAAAWATSREVADCLRAAAVAGPGPAAMDQLLLRMSSVCLGLGWSSLDAPSICAIIYSYGKARHRNDALVAHLLAALPNHIGSSAAQSPLPNHIGSSAAPVQMPQELAATIPLAVLPGPPSVSTGPAVPPGPPTLSTCPTLSPGPAVTPGPQHAPAHPAAGPTGPSGPGSAVAAGSGRRGLAGRDIGRACNGLVNLDYSDEAAMRLLVSALGRLPPDDLDAQSLANVALAFAKLCGGGLPDGALIKLLSHRVVRLDPMALEGRHVASLWYSVARLRARPAALLEHLSAAALVRLPIETQAPAQPGPVALEPGPVALGRGGSSRVGASPPPGGLGGGPPAAAVAPPAARRVWGSPVGGPGPDPGPTDSDSVESDLLSDGLESAEGGIRDASVVDGGGKWRCQWDRGDASGTDASMNKDGDDARGGVGPTARPAAAALAATGFSPQVCLLFDPVGLPFDPAAL